MVGVHEHVDCGLVRSLKHLDACMSSNHDDEHAHEYLVSISKCTFLFYILEWQ